MLFLLGTGARIGEALALRWEHVNLETGRCEIRGTKTATSDRVVTLPDWLLEVMQDRVKADGTGLAFPAPTLGDPEAPWDKSNVSKAVREFLDAADLPWAVSHTLRRSVATRLHENGTPVNRVADQLGHRDASVTARVYLGRDMLGDKVDLAGLL